MPPAAAYWRPWPGGGTRDLREDHPMGFHGFMDFMDFMDPIWIYIKKNQWIHRYLLWILWIQDENHPVGPCWSCKNSGP